MFASLDEMKMEANNSLEGIDPQEFLSFITGLVRVSKGMDVELREADLQANRREFSRMWQERMLIYRERMMG